MGVLMSWAQWLETSPWGYPVRTSQWLYPFIQLIHFSGLSLWIGTNLAVDMRLIGIRRSRSTAAQIQEQVFAWNWTGFAIVVLGGFLLFSASATTFLQNAAFLVKLKYLVPLALIWHIIVQVKTPQWGQSDRTALAGRLAGALEICLWMSVAMAAVPIPTY